MGTYSGGHDAFFIDGDSQTLTLVSAGGATVSTTVFGSQTRAVRLLALGAVSSTAAARVKVVSPADSVVTSVTGFTLVPNFPEVIKVNPGQRVSAISNDAAVATLVVTPLT
jgi:hypothetical protein